MIRSAIYVPGNVPEMLDQAGMFGADAVILDLEDTVPAAEKKEARGMVRDVLGRIKGPMRFVRINGIMTGLFKDDLTAVFCEELDGVYLPKVESSRELEQVDSLLSELEEKAGLDKGRVEIHPLFESARGIMNAYGILEKSTARVRKAGFGAVDLMRDISVQFGPRLWKSDGLELLFARSQLVFSTRAAGKSAPIDSVYINISDLDGLEKEALLARRLGFQGKSAVHPDQVAVINKVFTPSADEINYAKKVIAAFEEAEARGSASLTVGESFVDIPIVEKARSIVQKYGDLVK